MPRPTNTIKTEIVMLRLTTQQLAAIDALAIEAGESRSAALRMALRAGLRSLDVTRVQ